MAPTLYPFSILSELPRLSPSLEFSNLVLAIIFQEDSVDLNSWTSALTPTQWAEWCHCDIAAFEREAVYLCNDRALARQIRRDGFVCFQLIPEAFADASDYVKGGR